MMRVPRSPPRNLAVRLARSLILAAIATVFVMLIAQWRLGTLRIEGDSTEKARDSAEVLATSVASALFELSEPGVTSAVEATFRKPHTIQVVVWGQDGVTPWASYRLVEEQVIRIDNPRPAEHAVSSRYPVFPPDRGVVPFEAIGYVEVWTDMGLARQELYRTVLIESAQLAGLVVVLTGLAFLVANQRVVVPTAQLGQALQEVGQAMNQGEPTAGIQAKFSKVSAPIREQGAEVDAIVREFDHVFETVAARERQLREREDELASVLNTALGVIYVLEIKDLKVLYSNQQARQFFSVVSNTDGSIDLDKLAQRFHPDDYSKLVERLDQYASGEQPQNPRIVLRESHRGRSWRYWDSIESPFHLDAEGKPTHLVGHAVDITDAMLAQRTLEEINLELERKVAARTEALGRINAELESFSYSVSHDLRTPLRAIHGFSRILLEDFGPKFDPECKALFERIISASNRMSQLIDAMLHLSKASRHTAPRTTLNATEVAESLVQQLRAQHPERRVEVWVQPGMWANAYPQLFESILQNLLVNSWNYTDQVESPRIEVGSEEVEGEIIYYVRDNGEGFDPSLAEMLFTPFQRFRPDDEHEGMGIGLSTAKRLVHRHGGRIWAEGELGLGSTFWFTVEPRH